MIVDPIGQRLRVSRTSIALGIKTLLHQGDQSRHPLRRRPSDRTSRKRRRARLSAKLPRCSRRSYAGRPVKISHKIEPKANTSGAFVDAIDFSARLLGTHIGRRAERRALDRPRREKSPESVILSGPFVERAEMIEVELCLAPLPSPNRLRASRRTDRASRSRASSRDEARLGYEHNPLRCRRR